MQFSVQELYYGLGVIVILVGFAANIFITYRTHVRAWETPMAELNKAFNEYQGKTDMRIKEIETYQHVIVDGLGELRRMLLDKTRSDIARDERLDAKVTELYKVLLHAQWRTPDDVE